MSILQAGETCETCVKLHISAKTNLKNTGNDNTSVVLNYIIKHSSNMVQEENLEEIQSYAQLEEDKTNRLSSAFTICSTASSSSGEIIFFTLLGEDDNQVLSAFFSNEEARKGGKKNSYAGLFVSGMWTVAPSPFGLVFPNERVRSCVAISTESGIVHGVVEGHVMLNQTFEDLTHKDRFPQGLAGKLLLGVLQWEGTWFASSNKISNLNIFSSALSVDQMRRITSDDSKGECGRKGDYLAWEDMVWSVRGRVGKEIEDQDNVCRLRREFLVFYTRFQNMFSCMHLCPKFGTRVPSIVTFEKWSRLQLFLKEEVFDRPLNKSLKIWMSMVKKKDEWRDFYNDQLVQYQAVTKTGNESTVSGGHRWWERQSCVAQGNTDRF